MASGQWHNSIISSDVTKENTAAAAAVFLIEIEIEQGVVVEVGESRSIVFVTTAKVMTTMDRMTLIAAAADDDDSWRCWWSGYYRTADFSSCSSVATAAVTLLTLSVVADIVVVAVSSVPTWYIPSDTLSLSLSLSSFFVALSCALSLSLLSCSRCCPLAVFSRSLSGGTKGKSN